MNIYFEGQTNLLFFNRRARCRWGRNARTCWNTTFSSPMLSQLLSVGFNWVMSRRTPLIIRFYDTRNCLIIHTTRARESESEPRKVSEQSDAAIAWSTWTIVKSLNPRSWEYSKQRQKHQIKNKKKISHLFRFKMSDDVLSTVTMRAAEKRKTFLVVKVKAVEICWYFSLYFFFWLRIEKKMYMTTQTTSSCDVSSGVLWTILALDWLLERKSSSRARDASLIFSRLNYFLLRCQIE